MRAARRCALVMIIFVSAVAGAACFQSDSPDASCPEGWDLVTRYQLYFGRGDGTGTPYAVSDADWEQFLADAITPRFPDGLTVTDGAGQWQAESGEVLKEGTRILTVLVWPDDQALPRLNGIANEYELRFNQESVLLTSSQSCASFS